MGTRITTWMLTAACLMASPVYANTSAALEQVLDELGTHAAPSQVARLREAIASSPSLQAQLNALAASGQLTRFAVGDQAALPPSPGPFSAWIHGTTWAFRTGFIDQHGKKLLLHALTPSEILPDNLVFALGHLAYKAKTAREMEAILPSRSFAGRQQYVALHIRNDAEATIQAWNDTVDAAERENGGAPLNAIQASSLMMNLQYRAALLKAMYVPGNDKLGIARDMSTCPIALGDGRLAFASDWRIGMTAANVSAIANALCTLPLLDMQ